MERRILALGRALRAAGAPVSTPEVIDGARAALAVGVARRGDLRAALRAALVKRAEDLPAFDEHFERLFPAGIPRPVRRRGDKARAAGFPARARARGPAKAPARRRRAGTANPPVRAPQQTAAATSGQRVRTKARKPTRTRGKQSRGSRKPSPRRTQGGGGGAAVGRGARARAQRTAPPKLRPVPRRGPSPPARQGLPRALERREEREAAAAMEELASRLASRPALRRRRARRGSPDMAGTLRANLVHGGVPFVLRRRGRVIGRRDLVLLADVSGSVRRAAAMFLTILGRLHGRFAGVRAFAYVDRPAEIPATLARAPAAEIAAALATALPLDALSDHGEALRRFNRDFPGAVGGRSVVVILGDARNNRFPAQEWELEAIRRRCRRLVWIVPEPPSLWGSGDSAIRAYAPLCDRVIAAPTPQALAAAAAALARGNALRATRRRTR